MAFIGVTVEWADSGIGLTFIAKDLKNIMGRKGARIKDLGKALERRFGLTHVELSVSQPWA